MTEQHAPGRPPRFQPKGGPAEIPNIPDEMPMIPGIPEIPLPTAPEHPLQSVPEIPERHVPERPYSDDVPHEGRALYELDVDRMVNEGLGGGRVTIHNGLIGDATTDRPD